MIDEVGTTSLNMINKLLGSFFIISFISDVAKYIGQVDAGCLDCLLLWGMPDGPSDSHRHRPQPNNQWTPVLKLIDKHLSTKVWNDSLDENLQEIAALLVLEDAPDPPPHGNIGRDTGRPRLSQQITSQDGKFLATNALLALLSLDTARIAGQECLLSTTIKLSELNSMAMDPIDRRVRNEPDRYLRIDDLLFNTALRRANICLPRYKDQLMLMSLRRDDSYSKMTDYLDKVLERQLSREKSRNGTTADELFLKNPKAALEFVKGTHSALEPDLAVEDVEESVLRPCKNYVELAFGALESLEFDMKLIRFVQKSVRDLLDEYEAVIQRQQVYFLMCKKLTREPSIK